MTAEFNNEVDDELNTTAPQGKPDTWKMPEPVFRRTSGKLPQGFEKSYESVSATEPTDESSDGHSPTEPAAEVPAPIETKPKSPFLKIVAVILGLTAMVGFLIVFLTVIYFFFLRSAD